MKPYGMTVFILLMRSWYRFRLHPNPCLQPLSSAHEGNDSTVSTQAASSLSSLRKVVLEYAVRNAADLGYERRYFRCVDDGGGDVNYISKT